MIAEDEQHRRLGVLELLLVGGRGVPPSGGSLRDSTDLPDEVFGNPRLERVQALEKLGNRLDRRRRLDHLADQENPFE